MRYLKKNTNIKVETEERIPYLYGLVSYGYDCGDENYPGMYAKVSREINWIEETIAKTIPRTAENF